MSTINQKEYLKKYLSLGSDPNKKKRKKRSEKTNHRVKIIDDDLDVNLFNQAVEEDMYGANEDAPQIVGVIDDRPPELRIDDYRKSDMWKPVGSTVSNVMTKTEPKTISRDNSPIRREGDNTNEDLSPRRQRSYGDLSPKRNNKNSQSQSEKEVEKSKTKTVYRDRKTGKIRDFRKEAEEEKKKREKEDERTEKYTRWGRGLKQVEDYGRKLNEDLHEMNKPLARYADDEDLERYLKEQERDGDPMLAYLRKKKKREDIEVNKPTKPQYEGEFMPNRYGIRPGHRWDGVDRSNGYEMKWIQQVNSQSAQQEDVYKWSIEDM